MHPHLRSRINHGRHHSLPKGPRPSYPGMGSRDHRVAVVVGSLRRKAHGQQKALTVASMRRPPGVKGKARKGGGAATRWRVVPPPKKHDFCHPMWPACQRREEGCQGSRCGRLAQPLTTRFPERSSRPDRMTDRSALPCALGCRPVWVHQEIPTSPRFHSHSRGVLDLGLGARWCPGRSGAAIYQTVSSGVALPPRPSHGSQSPGQGLGRLLLAC